MPLNSFTFKVSSTKFTTTLRTSDGVRVARAEIIHPRDFREAEWGILPAEIKYSIMGDNSPEFAELMSYTLQRAAELARGLNREKENEKANEKRAAERDR